MTASTPVPPPTVPPASATHPDPVPGFIPPRPTPNPASPGSAGPAPMPTVAAPAGPQPVSAPAGPQPVMSIMSLVIGGSALLIGAPFAMSIAGLVLGFLALKAEPQGRTMAIAGIITNGVAILMGIFALIISLVVLVVVSLMPLGLLAGIDWP